MEKTFYRPASHDNPDAEIARTQSNEDKESRPRQKRRRALRVLATYEVVQHWVTGYRAKQPEEDIELLIVEHERNVMHLSGLKILPVHKVCAADWAHDRDNFFPFPTFRFPTFEKNLKHKI